AQIAVEDRRFPEFTPKGLKIGRLELYPALKTGVIYTDNVYQSGKNGKSDRIYTVAPRVTGGLSLAGDHDFLFDIGAARYEYATTGDQSYTDLNMLGEFDVGLSSAARLNIGSYFKRLHERRNESGIEGAIPFAPVRSLRNGFFTGLTFKPSHYQ